MERRGRAYISDVSSEEGDSESDDDSISIRSFPGRSGTSTAQQPPIHHLEDSDIEDGDEANTMLNVSSSIGGYRASCLLREREAKATVWSSPSVPFWKSAAPIPSLEAST